MKKIRILSLALALSLTSFQVSCSRDSTTDENSAQNETVDGLYSVVRTVESDLSQGFLLRNSSVNERKMFTDVLYQIKIATMRLRKNVGDGEALSALYLASQEFDKLNILAQDGSRLDGLKQQLRLTLDQIAALQGKTLENVERVLFAKDFDYELAPFASLTANSKAGWTKKNYNEIHYAIAEGSKLNSWLMSPLLDLTLVSNPSFMVKQAINSRGNPFSDSVFYMVSTNYTGGDPAKADWDTLQVERLPDGNGFASSETENVSLAKYAGKKIVLAFHYDSTAASTYPTWQINSFRFFGSGTMTTTPLSLAGATITGAGGNIQTIAALCTTNPSAKKIFSYQFNKSDLGTNFTRKEEIPMISTAYEKYPNVVRFSGFNGSDKPNKVGTSWLISKTFDLSAAKDVCLSFADESYFSNGNIDLNQVEVLVSTDFTGDTEKATWKTVNITTRKAATGVVKADSVSPKPVAIFLKDLGFEGVAKATIAFRYKSTLDSSPWWAVSDLTLTAVQAGDAPLVLTSVDAVAAGTASTSARPSATSPAAAPAFTPGSPVVADICKSAPGSKSLLSKQFLTTDLGTDFTVIDPLKNIGLPSTEFYPGFIRFSGFNKEGNRAGAAWLVSKPIAVANAKDLCLSVAEDIYSLKNTSDTSTIEILVSTDYAGDVNTATWTTVPMSNRKIQSSNVAKGKENPRPNGIMLKGLIGADAETITLAFKHTTSATVSAWWGIADVTVTAVSASQILAPLAKPEAPTVVPVSESVTPPVEPVLPVVASDPAPV